MTTSHITVGVRRSADAVVRKLLAIPGVRPAGRRPLTARLDELAVRYRALGGDPAHLLS